MGQAKRKGKTYEERVAKALERQQAQTAAHEAARRKRVQQEADAYHIMVWWQEDMSMERSKRIAKKRHSEAMTMATIAGVLNTFIYRRF